MFLTNHFDLSALTITELYRCRWQVELFFKWIKQHLRIKTFSATSENAVKTQVWIAIAVYVLVAVVKKRLKLDTSLYTILQILSLTLFGKLPLDQLLACFAREDESVENGNQLNPFTRSPDTPGIDCKIMRVRTTASALPMLSGEQERRAVIRRAGKLALGVGVFCAIFFLTGELVLWLVFSEGESFSAHYGPMVKRFERDFKFNRFDGPSRGPEPSDPKPPRSTRIVIQGDSITWGQGVKKEEQLFSNRLLSKLQVTNVPVDMAVLARPGREIDEHLQQLQKWGHELKPDVIIYQWSINDIDPGKGYRQLKPSRLWRHPWFLHSMLVKNSYLWFFLDFSLDTLLPSATPLSYESYIGSHFKEGSADWLRFERYFSDWAMSAKELTPRVIVALYPHMSLKNGASPVVLPEITDIHERMLSLCKKNDIVCVDLSASLTKFDDSRDVKASAFDNHPSAEAHRVIAESLYEILRGSTVKLPS